MTIDAFHIHIYILIVNFLISCRHDGLIIMATNRPFDLDEAMHHRITIALEFHQPDHLPRKAIWESRIPPEMKMAAKDVDLVRHYSQ